MHKKALEKKFVEAIKQHERIIIKISNLYAYSRDERHDLYQEIVLQMWHSFANFNGDSKLSTWMYRVAINTAVGQLRRTKKKISALSLNDYEYQIPDLETPETPEQLKHLYHAISQLSALDKAIIVLYLDANPYDEIALITGLTPTNISTKIGRIKERLKQIIEKDNNY